MKSCRIDDVRLSAYARGDADAEETQRISSHIADCRQCRERTDALYTLQSAMRVSLEIPAESPDFIESTMPLILANRPHRRPRRAWAWATVVCLLAVTVYALVSPRSGLDVQPVTVTGQVQPAQSVAQSNETRVARSATGAAGTKGILPMHHRERPGRRRHCAAVNRRRGVHRSRMAEGTRPVLRPRGIATGSIPALSPRVEIQTEHIPAQSEAGRSASRILASLSVGGYRHTRVTESIITPVEQALDAEYIERPPLETRILGEEQ